MTSKVKNHFSQAYFNIISRFFQLLVMSIWSCHMAKPYMASHAWQGHIWQAMHGKPCMASPYMARPCMALPCMARPCMAKPCMAKPCGRCRGRGRGRRRGRCRGSCRGPCLRLRQETCSRNLALKKLPSKLKTCHKNTLNLH